MQLSTGRVVRTEVPAFVVYVRSVRVTLNPLSIKPLGAACVCTGKALLRRASAFEGKGDYQRSLADLRGLIEDASTAPNTKMEAETQMQKLDAMKNTTKKQRAKQRAALQAQSQERSAMTSRYPPQGAPSAAYNQAMAAQQAAMAQRQKPAMQPLQLKVTLGSDTRTLQVKTVALWRVALSNP